ncbi:MAG: DNA alkylation repair protein [Bacteroidales bacterium]|nr:DNA alkylation repair protein [Bacteroidales bacterium]
MSTDDILVERLRELGDERYAEFASALIPDAPKGYVLGVRSPELKNLAKEIAADDPFLSNLPHRFHEENLLHAYVLNRVKDYSHVLSLTQKFLPYVDNWAVCDSLSPKAFAKNADLLLPEIRRWLAANHPCTVRFAIGCLMRYFLGENFKKEYLKLVASVSREEYYIKMMQAWYFATALAKQWNSTLPYISERRLGDWVHRKSIQKAIESYRITPYQKTLLRSLK